MKFQRFWQIRSPKRNRLKIRSAQGSASNLVLNLCDLTAFESHFDEIISNLKRAVIDRGLNL